MYPAFSDPAAMISSLAVSPVWSLHKCSKKPAGQLFHICKHGKRAVQAAVYPLAISYPQNQRGSSREIQDQALLAYPQNPLANQTLEIIIAVLFPFVDTSPDNDTKMKQSIFMHFPQQYMIC